MPIILQSPPQLRLAAQKQFLDAIRTHAPSVLVSLTKDVFPIWEKLKKAGYRSPEALNRHDFLPTQLRRIIEKLMSRLKQDNRDEARLLYGNLEGLFNALARFKDEPGKQNPDGTVSITIRFVPCRTIVEQSHPLDKVLLITEAMYHGHALSLLFNDRKRWESIDILKEYSLWSKLYEAVKAWLEDHHLARPWLADCVLQTIGSWTRFRRKSFGYFEYDDKDTLIRFVPDELNWKYKAWPDLIGPDKIKQSTFNYTEWSPDIEDWKSYQREQEKRFRRHLSDYRKRTLQSLGKRKPHIARRKHADYHFEWLVDYQLNGLRLSEIIAKYHQSGGRGLSHSTVSEAIYSLARLIDLTPRTQSRKPTQS